MERGKTRTLGIREHLVYFDNVKFHFVRNLGFNFLREQIDIIAV